MHYGTYKKYVIIHILIHKGTTGVRHGLLCDYRYRGGSVATLPQLPAKRKGTLSGSQTILCEQVSLTNCI